MILRLLALLVVLATPATAAPVVLQAGEHDGFTRLVLDYGHPVDWQVGRSADGYELAIAAEHPVYDLRSAFAAIGQSRLAAIWADPASGNLRVGIACACHAIPFEFRPGIVVIDLRDGPPPEGSAFEVGLDGQVPDPQLAQTRPRPRPRPSPQPPVYDWLAARAGDPPGQAVQPPRPAAKPAESPSLPIPGGVALDPLRDQILRELAQGAAQGLVAMEGPRPDTRNGPLPDFASAQVRIGEGAPNISDPADSVDGTLGATGQSCIKADRLAISTWGDETPVDRQWTAVMSGLVGEFDRPDPEAVTRAARFLLFIGFGAETRRLLEAFPIDNPDVQLWRGLSRLVDDEPDPEHVFAGLAACDGPSALWAFLTMEDPRPGDIVNAPAIRLEFSRLPPHLRDLTGPRLAARFLAMGNAEAARAIGDAISRTGAEPEGEVARMSASLSQAQGETATAEADLERLVAEGGESALADLVELRAGDGRTVPETYATALEAALMERRGTADEPRFRRALTLARAAAGDFDTALAEPELEPELRGQVWSLLARLGQDESVLRHAILGAAPVPDLPAETKLALTRRLHALGFHAEAARWLAGEEGLDPALTASLALALTQPVEAIARIGTATDAEGTRLRAEAELLQGDHAAAAISFDQAGDPAAAVHALALGQNWPALARREGAAWAPLAREVGEAQAEPAAAGPEGPPLIGGPLARGRALVAASATTREAVNALLAATANP